MRNFVLISVTCTGLMACSPPVPDSAKGVGFENYDAYLAQQQARQVQNTQPAPQPVATSQVPATNSVQTAEQQIASDAVAAVRSGEQNAPVTTTASAAPPVQTNNASISDEQDFQAVSSRRTIEDDAARVQQTRSQYAVIRPTEVPNRPGGTTQTPIQFALATSHPVGQKTYRRGLGGARKAQSVCAQFESPEKAQDQFLKNGGPEKDKLGVDPDGDGYACAWNPATYRGLVRG